ncbi:hypothetical protein AJ80_07625 [Polytolypa hystricis UAMH7299]|uniref:Beta-galactosidase n=1 Tax=Polytolypa hystricis (strain UAMH7299) TaxID=1447883 RepID=A0A2B7XM86_POLH7|nr:hypothetical protein AJ80_07625 [Polytolypa hystricis UAMH7299]
MKLCILILACVVLQSAAASVVHRVRNLDVTDHHEPSKHKLLQDIVKWDNESLFIHGERLMIFSGEVHPYRLPVPSLWLDIFQKIKALGFNCVSFYIDWALLEGKPGEYSAEGIFALEPFFEAATTAGIYLLARPGPYINSEVSGGGFPGWLQRVKGVLRTSAPDYLAATDNYIAHIAATIAKAQITNGGPVIMYQPENEYSGACCGVTFPDPDYMQSVIDQARDAGIVVPMISNDVYPSGHNAPGTGKGELDIYGHDSYPLGFDCANPSVWPPGNLPTDWRALHLQLSPNTPYSLIEFQAGAFDPWGGPGFHKCAELVNHEFERVFYKNNIGFGVTILNLYMTFGGTNWGNLGHPGGYSSYDYGSPIAEDRNITREKYSELKLLGNFIKVSPSYINAVPGNLTNSEYTDTSALTVTPLIGRLSKSNYFVLRHSDYTSTSSTGYKLSLPTSQGKLTIPQLGGSLTLHGRDSKIHVTDYDVAGTNILYSTAEIFTWKQFAESKVLVVYGGMGERHELAIVTESKLSVAEGSSEDVNIESADGYTIINWDTSSERRIVTAGDLYIFILDRNSAYDYWVPQLPKKGIHPGFSSAENTASSIIVKAGYLVRAAYLRGSELHIAADFNATTALEVIGAPKTAKGLYVNGDRVKYGVNEHGFWSASVKYDPPKFKIPALEDLEWKSIDALPELQATYDDSPWTDADETDSNNSLRAPTTPTSLYSSDYGYHTGYLLYRGHFVAKGVEKTLSISIQGGSAFASSVWLNQTYLGSWAGTDKSNDQTSTYKLPKLSTGKTYIFTVLIDNMGLDGNWVIGEETMKNPRGILDYELSGRDAEDITWKLTGNLGGEDYRDRARGPLNEGGLYIERQGWHQPQPPSDAWESANPITDGISSAGVRFFTTKFDLHVPKGWDVPLYFTFSNMTSPPTPYRVQLYVNGFQYGKYVSNIGPQTSFPVPQGILNYNGANWLGVTLWALDGEGAKIEGLNLEYRGAVMTALKDIKLVDAPKFKKRKGAY